MTNVIKLSLVTTLLSSSLLFADSLENMAESLINLRAEVETLSSELQDNKDTYKGSMRSLVMQKNSLEATIAREDLKIKQIDAELSKVKKEIKEASKNSTGLKPLVLEALDLIEANVNDSIPFKTSDRVRDIQTIRTQLQSDLVTPQKALALTWNIYSDAIRMTKENGIFKQTITLDNKDRLVEVARIGTVMMYFKAPDNTVGFVVKDAHGYNYQVEQNKENQDAILTLFDAFKKQIRTGYFPLPNALVSMEVK